MYQRSRYIHYCYLKKMTIHVALFLFQFVTHSVPMELWIYVPEV